MFPADTDSYNMGCSLYRTDSTTSSRSSSPYESYRGRQIVQIPYIDLDQAYEDLQHSTTAFISYFSTPNIDFPDVPPSTFRSTASSQQITPASTRARNKFSTHIQQHRTLYPAMTQSFNTLREACLQQLSYTGLSEYEMQQEMEILRASLKVPITRTTEGQLAPSILASLYVLKHWAVHPATTYVRPMTSLLAIHAYETGVMPTLPKAVDVSQRLTECMGRGVRVNPIAARNKLRQWEESNEGAISWALEEMIAQNEGVVTEEED